MSFWENVVLFLFLWSLNLTFQLVAMSCQVAMRYTRKYGADKVRVLTLVKNRGKGGAVRMVRLNVDLHCVSAERRSGSSTGLILWFVLYIRHQGTMSSRGKVILMADADGATKFSDLEKVEAGLAGLSSNTVWQWSCSHLFLTFVCR